MFLLSILSFFNVYTFILLTISFMKRNSKERLNQLAAMSAICFAIWNFAHTFYFQAENLESAIIWHKLSSFGWIFFVPFAIHFILQMVEKDRNQIMMKGHVISLYILYGLSFVLFMKSMISPVSAFVSDLRLSENGYGYLYVIDTHSIWLYLYLAGIILLFFSAIIVSFYWAKKKHRKNLKKQAYGIAILDIIMLFTGAMSDIIVPILHIDFPPIFSLISILWGIAFYIIIQNYKVMTPEDLASPELILSTVMDPILFLNRDAQIVKCNEAAIKLFKCSTEELIGTSFYALLQNEEINQERYDLLMELGKVRVSEMILKDFNNKVIYAETSFSLAENEKDGFVGIVASIHNVTEYKKKAENLENIAYRDNLTNLHNRHYFTQKVEVCLKNYNLTGEGFLLVFMDLDGFKNINDLYGHGVGDKLLIECANRIQEVLRKEDDIARIGGDEFVLLLRGIDEDTFLRNMMLRIYSKFLIPFEIDGKICKVGVSAGISSCPKDGTTIDVLLNKSDERMYQEKKRK